MPDAFLGKDAHCWLATDSGIIDLTPDFGGFTIDGVSNNAVIMPVASDETLRNVITVDHTITIDSLRWAENSQFLASLVLGSEYTFIAALQELKTNVVIPGFAQTVIASGKGTSVPTSDLVEVNLSMQTSGKWHTATGAVAAGTAPAATDATGFLLANYPAQSTGSHTTTSRKVRSGRHENTIMMLLLEAPKASSDNSTFIVNANQAGNGAAVSGISFTGPQVQTNSLLIADKPTDWAGLEVDWNLERRSTGAAKAGQVLLLGTR